MKIKYYLLKWHHLPIWQQVVAGLVLGMITGLICGDTLIFLKPLGTLFINALHMVIVPVIFSAVVCAVTSVSDFSQIKRITVKAFLLYFSLLLIATLIAIVLGKILAPGTGLSAMILTDAGKSLVLDAPEVTKTTAAQVPGLMSILINMVPKNPVAAFLNENILQIVIFGILLGIAINISDEQGKPLAQLFRSISEVSRNLTAMIMRLAPYGVFALIAWTFGMFGLKALIPLLTFIATLLLSCFVMVFLVYGTILVVFLKQSPLSFIKKIMPAIAFAISTSSSGATLPVSIKVAEEELAVPSSISKFLLPLGCNFNLSGLAIYLTVAVIFTANMYSLSLGPVDYLCLISTVILTTMGTGAIPGSGIIVMSAVLAAMGMPLGALPLIAGIDRISDMIQTTTNVISDIFAAYIISESENSKELSSSAYSTNN